MLRSVGLQCAMIIPLFFFSSRRRHTSCSRDWSSDVCSSDLILLLSAGILACQQGLSTEPPLPPGTRVGWYVTRSEERRVGKECRSRGAPEQLQKKKEHQRGEESVRFTEVASQGVSLMLSHVR